MDWRLDTTRETYGDQNLFVDDDMVGWVRKATGGEMIWTTCLEKNTAQKTTVLGHISADEAKAVAEALVRLEG